MFNFFIGLELCAIGTLFFAIVLLATSDGAKEQKVMCLFLCGCLIQNVGYFTELTAPTLEAAMASVRAQYLGSLFVPLCYCCFMYNYCYAKMPKKLLKLLGMVDILLMLEILFVDSNKLYYKGMEWLTAPNGHHYLSLDYGPLYPVFALCGCIIPYALSLFILSRALILRPDQAASRKYKMIMVLSTFPLLAFVSYALKLTYIYDLTPSVMGLTLSLVVILLWRARTKDFRRLAADAVLNNMGDGVISLDEQKRIRGYNQAAANIFTDIANHEEGDSMEEIADFPTEILDGNANQEFQLGERYYESHVKQILDEEQKNQGYVILLLDVTDTRNYIEEIKRVREQAEKANTAKSEFLANMSHEIRTPMNAIIGLSDIIMEESRGLKMYFYASDIKSASKNLLTIINDILDLSKVEAGKMELVLSDYYIKPMVNEVVSMMDMAASQKGLILKYEVDSSIPCKYYGDEGRIRQILINLLNNAIKFTAKGHVGIYLEGKPADVPGKELLIFRVEDTGCGIREEDQEKIFEDFKQVDAKRNRTAEGTGLGLAICRHLVQLMEGTITLESVYEKGTTFTVTIPQKIIDERTIAEVPERPVQKEEKSETFVAKGCRVLVVDDNLINRKVAKGFLKTYRFDLSEAVSGPEAIALVRKRKFDIIFMDHMMPEMDGIEAVRIIREECGENGKTPVIIALTANAMEGVREKFLENGFQDFLPKPMDRKSLNEILLKWVPEDMRQKQTNEGGEDTESSEALHREDIHIKGIDGEAVERYQSGSWSDYEELLQLYCTDGKRKLPLLAKLYENKDYASYEVEVHALKSASANIGAMKLSAVAKEHEEAAARGDAEYIERHFKDLTADYEKQLKYIRDFLDKSRHPEKGKQSTQENAESAEVDREALIQEISQALEQLEDFHSKECAERLGGLLQRRLPAEVETNLIEIMEQLRLYEDDIAEQKLRKLLESMGKE